MSLFAELKRRNVVRMAVLYGVASWLILQIADVLFDQLAVPPWAFRLVLGLLILGFPLALIFSWIFELTPEGLKRESEVDRRQSITHRTGHKINIAIIVLLVLAIGTVIANRLIPMQRPVSTPPTGQRGAHAPATAAAEETASPEDRLSVAVLPFVNMSGDPDNEYFSDGLSEELLNTLAQIRELKVTGRTSSFAFKGKNLDLRDIGERLSVANVLEGSVRKAANRVRITAQLIKTSDGYHLWSETFDRQLDDIFAIQQEIAEKVAAALSVTLLGKSARNMGKTNNADAYQAYLRGAQVFRRAPDDFDSLQAARALYEQSLALDPDYVAPVYGMFKYWVRMNRNGNGTFEANLREMNSLADRLAQLAPGSIEALLAQGQVNTMRFDRTAAATWFREAKDRYPGSVETNTAYGGSVFSPKHPEEGLNAVKTALSLDPLSLGALTLLSNMQMQLGHCSETKELSARALEIEPDFGRVRGQVAYCLLIRGDDPAEAMQWLEKEPLGFMRGTGRAIALHRLGKRQQAEHELQQMMDSYGDTASYQYAQVYAQWGDLQRALDWLHKALEVHDPGILGIAADPFLDPLRQNPQFQALLPQAGVGAGSEQHLGSE